MTTEYNLPQAMSRCLPARLALALLFALAATANAATPPAERGQMSDVQRWEEQSSEFARKIAGISGPATATLEVRNISSFPAEQALAVRRAVESHLRASGIQIRPEHQASVAIRITFSENERGWLWIAEVVQGIETRVAMLEVPQERAQNAAIAALPITMQSSLLLSSPDVLLDVQPLSTPQPMLAALTTHSVLLYVQQGARWQSVRELPIPLPLHLPRDPRGRIVAAADHPFNLYLPGANCAAVAEAAEVALNCIASDDPWPLGGQSAFYNAARNYFTGVLVPGTDRVLPPFFSAAPVGEERSALWVFARADGRVSLFDGANERILNAVARGWGSDLAAVRSGCGSGTQLLAAGNGAGTPTDSLQAFEIADREAQPASAAMKLDGAITALWSAPGGGSATAITRTAQGGYDAYSISLACNQ